MPHSLSSVKEANRGKQAQLFHLRLPDAAAVAARKLAVPFENMAGMRFNDGRYSAAEGRSPA